MKQDANAVTLEYVNRWGDHHTLALYRDSYAMGGGFAISALDATDPADSEYLSPWSDITVNIPDNPDAAWWCATEGNVIIDTNNNSKELVDALVGAGIITLTDRVCHSGYCTYPFAKVAPWAMEAMGTYEETIDRLTADTAGGTSAGRTHAAPGARRSRLRIKDRMQEPLRGAAEQARQASEQFTQDTPGISPAKENNR